MLTCLSEETPSMLFNFKFMVSMCTLRWCTSAASFLWSDAVGDLCSTLVLCSSGRYRMKRLRSSSSSDTSDNESESLVKETP